MSSIEKMSDIPKFDGKDFDMWWVPFLEYANLRGLSKSLKQIKATERRAKDRVLVVHLRVTNRKL